jgi:hypothetical protein
MGWAKFRNAVTGVAQQVATAGLTAPLTSAMSATAGAVGLAGMLLGGGGLPQPGSGGGCYSGQSQDFGPQQNIAGLMNMVGQQQPTVSMTGNTVGGGGLI